MNVSRVIILAVSGSCRNLMNPIWFSLMLPLRTTSRLKHGPEGLVCPIEQAGSVSPGGFFKQEKKRIENDVVNKIAYRIFFLIKKILIEN